MRLNNFCPKIRMEMVFINTESSKINEPNKFVLNLSQRLDLSLNMLLFKTYLIIARGKI